MAVATSRSPGHAPEQAARNSRAGRWYPSLSPSQSLAQGLLAQGKIFMTSGHFSQAAVLASASLASLHGILWKTTIPQGTHGHFSEKKPVAKRTANELTNQGDKVKESLYFPEPSLF